LLVVDYKAEIEDARYVNEFRRQEKVRLNEVRDHCVGRIDLLMRIHSYNLNRPSAAATECDRLQHQIGTIDAELRALDAKIAQTSQRILEHQKQLDDDAVRSKREAKRAKEAHRLAHDAGYAARREAEERARLERQQVREEKRLAKLDAQRIVDERKQQEKNLQDWISTKRWKDWGSTIEDEPSLPVPVVQASDTDSGGRPFVLCDEVDRRAAATMSWAPWGRHRRWSRRYEGHA
jgi:hypothetical protein